MEIYRSRTPLVRHSKVKSPESIYAYTDAIKYVCSIKMYVYPNESRQTLRSVNELVKIGTIGR